MFQVYHTDASVSNVNPVHLLVYKWQEKLLHLEPFSHTILRRNIFISELFQDSCHLYTSR
jgi:hypothetical protein